MSRDIDRQIGKKLFGIDNEYILNNFGLPHYSTDIAAAWEVVEKLREEDLCFNIWVDSGYCEVEIKEFTITKTPVTSHAYIENKSAPMAICLAALKALGEE